MEKLELLVSLPHCNFQKKIFSFEQIWISNTNDNNTTEGIVPYFLAVEQLLMLRICNHVQFI
jgi:hypothetical protein